MSQPAIFASHGAFGLVRINRIAKVVRAAGRGAEAQLVLHIVASAGPNPIVGLRRCRHFEPSGTMTSNRLTTVTRIRLDRAPLKS
jgi:hypothetical protein